MELVRGLDVPWGPPAIPPSLLAPTGPDSQPGLETPPVHKFVQQAFSILITPWPRVVQLVSVTGGLIPIQGIYKNQPMNA